MTQYNNLPFKEASVEARSRLLEQAAAVLHSTHTRKMEEMGGLIRRSPKTAFFFLMAR